MKDMNKKTESNLQQSVLNTIESENVCPRSRWFFVCKETLVWIFWALSVVIGAVAVAVCFFVMSYQQYALYEATHENFFTFFVGALPYIWFVVFAAMAILAVNNLRHTKRGYKHPVWKVVVSSLVFSVVGGAALQMFGLGYSIDHYLGEEMKMYMSQEKLEKGLWQAPEEGRLLGQLAEMDDSGANTVSFTDSYGEMWDVNIAELSEMDLGLLQSEDLVRVVGTTSSTTGKQFHACGVFPWMLDRSAKLEDLSQERQAFIERVYHHKDMAKERLAALEEETFESDPERLAEIMGICAEIAAVRRIGESMQ